MRMIPPQHIGCRMLRTVIPIAVFAGCSGPPGPETADVTGTLTLNGSPLEGASVTFYPLDNRENSLVCQAMTDSEGRLSFRHMLAAAATRAESHQGTTRWLSPSST